MSDLETTLIATAKQGNALLFKFDASEFVEVAGKRLPDVVESRARALPSVCVQH